MSKSVNILNELQLKKTENLLLMTKWSFEDLIEMSHRYYNAYKETESEIIYEKFSQVTEAITIKRGNEEEIWDFLT